MTGFEEFLRMDGDGHGRGTLEFRPLAVNSQFKDTVKNSVDIVRVIGEYVRLQRLGGTGRYRGLCPFHGEKTPSFYVHSDRQFFKCFGCGKGGDVFTFLVEIESLSFWEALKLLAERNGIPIPKMKDESDPESRKRAGLQDLHELAQKYFVHQLRSPAAAETRAYIERRGLSEESVHHFGLGFSDGGLHRVFQKEGVPAEMMEQSGLVLRRDDGSGFFDRFRKRLMFPITNESGKVIAFAGRALGDEQPKYLNSPETPIYHKTHVLYNLNSAREGARKSGRMILVEGYMDVIGVHSAGVREVVASCGTSLTREQVRSIKRHADKIIVNFDPDNAGANATERSIELLLEESLKIRVCSLPDKLDPDEYVKANGAEAYQQTLERSPSYFYWLTERARARIDMRDAEGRMDAFRFLLPSILKLPDKLERIAVATDISQQLNLDPALVLEQFRRGGTEKRPVQNQAPEAQLPDMEKLLLRLLLHHAPALSGYVDTILSMDAFGHLQCHKILEAALRLLEANGAIDFHELTTQLTAEQATLLTAVFSADTEDVEKNHADPGAQLRACLTKLEQDYWRYQLKEIRHRVRDAERRGDMGEAMQWMEQERSLESRLKRA